MNNLVPLHFEQTDIRMIRIDGMPWWVLVDLCRCLQISNSRKVAARLDDDERCNFKLHRGGEITLVSEPGLYKVFARSNAAVTSGTAAHRFCRWLTHEVLPSIRIWGQYPPPQFALEDPDREQDRRTTRLQRLLSECDRVAPKHGMTGDRLLANMLSKSEKSQVKNKSLNVLAMLHREDRWQTCDSHGMDLRYIMTGVWSLTPQERRIAEKMRSAQDAYRLEQPPPEVAITCEP